MVYPKEMYENRAALQRSTDFVDRSLVFFSEQRLKSFFGNSGLPDPRSTQKKCMKTKRLYSGLPDFVDRSLVFSQNKD